MKSTFPFFIIDLKMADLKVTCQIQTYISYISVSPDKKYCSCFRLTNSGQWKTGFTSPSVPGFFQAQLYVDGVPRDTFIRLDVSNRKQFI